jgi:hypothetical protein
MAAAKEGQCLNDKTVESVDSTCWKATQWRMRIGDGNAADWDSAIDLDGEN